MSGFSWNPLTDAGNLSNMLFGTGSGPSNGQANNQELINALEGKNAQGQQVPGWKNIVANGTVTSEAPMIPGLGDTGNSLSSSGGATSTVTTPAANLSFLPWAAGYTAFALVILGTQDMGDNAAKLGVAFAWLVTGYVVLTRYSMIASGFSNLFGQSG